MEKILPEEEIGFMNLDKTDFVSMSRPEQIRHLEVEGYVVFPEILSSELIGRMKEELAEIEMGHADYSINQSRAKVQPQWASQAVAELIGYRPILFSLGDFINLRNRVVQVSRYILMGNLMGLIYLGMREAVRDS